MRLLYTLYSLYSQTTPSIISIWMHRNQAEKLESSLFRVVNVDTYYSDVKPLEIRFFYLNFQATQVLVKEFFLYFTGKSTYLQKTVFFQLFLYSSCCALF